jgi:hypothetical protein
MRIAILVVASGAFAGCANAYEGAARTRLANEFHCPPQEVAIRHRPDLGVEVMDIDACGRHVRYACFAANRWGDVTCIREPDPR